MTGQEKRTMAEPLNVECPCCGTKLTLDSKTGDVLAEERPKMDPTKSFEQAMNEVRTGGQRREDAFTKAADRTRRLEDLLDKKFEEARKKAADDKTPFRNPLDMD
jgi:hypothetical protein